MKKHIIIRITILLLLFFSGFICSRVIGGMETENSDRIFRNIVFVNYMTVCMCYVGFYLLIESLWLDRIGKKENIKFNIITGILLLGFVIIYQNTFRPMFFSL